MMVRTTCLRCGQTQRIDFGSLDLAAAIAALDKLDVPGECPGGWHVELSGFPMLWQLGSALVLVYGAAAEKHPRVQNLIAHERSYRETGQLTEERRAKPVIIDEEVEKAA